MAFSGGRCCVYERYQPRRGSDDLQSDLIENVGVYLTIADKYDIPALKNEIRVRLLYSLDAYSGSASFSRRMFLMTRTNDTFWA